MVKLKLELPEHFLEEEVREGYTVSREMKELWAVELDLLAEFMRVCDAHGIRYYADAGTILGAVRHGGFIPWDDDIDVMMMRDQYDLLQKIGPAEFRHPYFFQTEWTDPGTLRGHAQLRNSMTTGIRAEEEPLHYPFNQGIFLDIFPIDGVPDDDLAFEVQLEEAERLLSRAKDRSRLRERFVPESSNPVRAALKAVRHQLYAGPLSFVDVYEKYYREYEAVISRYSHEPTRRVSKFFQVPRSEKARKRRVWQRSYFEGMEKLPFEMLTVPVPSGYLDILEQFYGDWKTPVRGTATHGGLIFDASRSYREYFERKGFA